MTHLVEVAVINEQAFVVRNRHDARARGNDLCRVVGNSFANRVWEFSTTSIASIRKYRENNVLNVPRVICTIQNIRDSVACRCYVSACDHFS